MIKQKDTTVIIATLVIFLTIFISGCGEESTPATGTNTTTPTTASDSSGCKSPYDGTYSGLVSGSGEMGRMVDSKWVETPYIITYNLELTFECQQNAPCSDNKNKQCWFLTMTHAKASDPFLGCTNGCTPIKGGSNWLEAPMPGESGGHLNLLLPNDVVIGAYPLVIDPDAKTIRADQTDHDTVIGSVLGIKGNALTDIEKTTFNCQDCLFVQEGYTMTLDRIS